MWFDVVQALNLAPLEANPLIHAQQSFRPSDNKNTLVPPLHGAKLEPDCPNPFLLPRLPVHLMGTVFAYSLISECLNQFYGVNTPYKEFGGRIKISDGQL